MTSDAPTAGWSLRRELTRMLVLTALLSALVFGMALLWSQWQRDQDDLKLRLGSNAQLSANAIDDFLQGQLSGVELMADGSMLSGRTLDEELGKLLRAYPAMLRALATDREGNIVAACSATGRPAAIAAEQVADREWFRTVRDGSRPHASDAYRARIYGSEALVAVSAPMWHDGAFEGVLQASIPIRAVHPRAFGQSATARVRAVAARSPGSRRPCEQGLALAIPRCDRNRGRDDPWRCGATGSTRRDAHPGRAVA